MAEILNKLFSPQGKVVVLTGAAGQIGSEFSKAFAQCGARVVGIDLKLPENRVDGVDYYACDISKQKEVKELFQTIVGKHGRIDVLINNAGVAVFTPFLERSEAELDFVVDVNVKGTFYCIQAYVDHFVNQKQTDGSIINVGSIFGVVSPDFRNYTDTARNSSEIYGATKAGVIQMTKYFAAHLASKGIRVNAISPGGILNEENPQGKDFQANYSFRCPMGRMAFVREMTGAALYLAGAGASYTTGQNIVVDGGMSSW